MNCQAKNGPGSMLTSGAKLEKNHRGHYYNTCDCTPCNSARARLEVAEAREAGVQQFSTPSHKYKRPTLKSYRPHKRMHTPSLSTLIAYCGDELAAMQVLAKMNARVALERAA